MRGVRGHLTRRQCHKMSPSRVVLVAGFRMVAGQPPSPRAESVTPGNVGKCRIDHGVVLAEIDGELRYSAQSARWQSLPCCRARPGTYRAFPRGDRAGSYCRFVPGNRGGVRWRTPRRRSRDGAARRPGRMGSPAAREPAGPIPVSGAPSTAAGGIPARRHRPPASARRALRWCPAGASPTTGRTARARASAAGRSSPSTAAPRRPGRISVASTADGSGRDGPATSAGEGKLSNYRGPNLRYWSSQRRACARSGRSPTCGGARSPAVQVNIGEKQVNVAQ